MVTGHKRSAYFCEVGYCIEGACKVEYYIAGRRELQKGQMRKFRIYLGIVIASSEWVWLKM